MTNCCWPFENIGLCLGTDTSRVQMISKGHNVAEFFAQVVARVQLPSDVFDFVLCGIEKGGTERFGDRSHVCSERDSCSRIPRRDTFSLNAFKVRKTWSRTRRITGR